MKLTNESENHFSIGVDFGTNSVRAIVVDLATGTEHGSAVWNYPRGTCGVLLDSAQPELARQSPIDYIVGLERVIGQAMEFAATTGEFSRRRVIGIGIDTTGSTPMPIDRQARSLSFLPTFIQDSDAMAWLWKDHTSHAEAAEITALAGAIRPNYLHKCGGRYSSEWFWAKILRCARVAPAVSAAAFTWVEIADWIPAMLCGVTDATLIRRGRCAAGHKAFHHPKWGGYPDADFLGQLHPELKRIGETLPTEVFSIASPAGTISSEWATKLGLPPGISVAVGAFDAHMGAIGSGIDDGTLVKIIGTSTCDIMISPMDRPIADVPGLCGIACESVLPDYFGLEAGQSAVGDIFDWFVSKLKAGGESESGHEALTRDAEMLMPGESGLLALDWHNGNRTVLVDQRLTGLILGLTLHTRPCEIYRALIEATAMGARTIMERFEEYGVPVRRVVNCGGISARNPMAMQIYADVMNRPINVSRSLQTCALGSAIAGAVVARSENGGYDDFVTAISAMSGAPGRIYQPIPKHVAVYERLYAQYRELHDAFGIKGKSQDLSPVMKSLLDIRDQSLAAVSSDSIRN
ncbi:ribulokinase [soil metagenome]